MTLVEDDARSTTMRHPHLYARTSWPCLKVTGLLATSHSPSAFVKRSPMRSCSGKMATASADEGRLRFGRSMTGQGYRKPRGALVTHANARGAGCGDSRDDTVRWQACAAG